jgi:hypothetical protein
VNEQLMKLESVRVIGSLGTKLYCEFSESIEGFSVARLSVSIETECVEPIIADD